VLLPRGKNLFVSYKCRDKQFTFVWFFHIQARFNNSSQQASKYWTENILYFGFDRFCVHYKQQVERIQNYVVFVYAVMEVTPMQVKFHFG
jgi:hypothetical protein